MCFDSTLAPVATAARAAGTGLVSMSTRPDIPGMPHLEREARDWSTYNEYSYRIIRAKLDSNRYIPIYVPGWGTFYVPHTYNLVSARMYLV